MEQRISPLFSCPCSSLSTLPLRNKHKLTMNVAQVVASASTLGPVDLSGGSTASSVKVNLYEDFPEMELTLDQFEIYALKRLKVLRKIEQLKMLKSQLSPDQARAKLDQVLRQEELNSDPFLDQASHFILRLSYCQNEELRRWFLLHESLLLEHRLSNLSSKVLAEAVSKYAQITPISEQVKKQLQDQLMIFVSPAEFAKSDFYRVPFCQALDLVQNRKCYLQNGYAYVPVSKVYHLLLAKFRSQLSGILARMGHMQHNKVEDNYDEEIDSGRASETTRVYPLLKNLHSSLVAREPSSGENHLGDSAVVSAASVPSLVPHMPLCMRQLHQGLKQDRKLKHWGRLQYGLFLKGAGLSMEDALAFFQRHFTAVTGEEFQKQYAYNIRHMYGREGKRATYTPYSCQKIIMGNPPSGSQDHHGCPYKHYDSDHLSGMLSKLQIGTPTDRREIIKLQKEKHYQLACQKHFQVSHPKAVGMEELSLDNVGNHPNAWFRASVQYHKATNQHSSSVVSPEK